METILYFMRDKLSGTFYFIYAFILGIFMFAIIGYLLKEKYGRLDIKFVTNQSTSKEKNNDANAKNIKEKNIIKSKNNKALENIDVNSNPVPITNQIQEEVKNSIPIPNDSSSNTDGTLIIDSSTNQMDDTII